MNGSGKIKPDAYDLMRLKELEQLTVHRDLRVAAALQYCADDDTPAPPWVVREAADLLCELLKREKSGKRGRAAGRVARYRQDAWDIERWDAVEEVRRIRKKKLHEMKIMRADKERFEGTPQWDNATRMLEWFKFGIFECASMYLKGRDAWASADTVRASHRRCKKRAAELGIDRPDRYFLFDEDFLVKLGLPRMSDRKPGTKWGLLYKLRP